MRVVVKHIAQRQETGDLIAGAQVTQLSERRDSRRGDDRRRGERGNSVD
jgi:hypothetical protein